MQRYLMLMLGDDFVPHPEALFDLKFMLAWVRHLDPVAETHFTFIHREQIWAPSPSPHFVAQIERQLPGGLDQGTHLAENDPIKKQNSYFSAVLVSCSDLPALPVLMPAWGRGRCAMAPPGSS